MEKKDADAEDECPICLEKYSLEPKNLRLKDSPSNSDIYENCPCRHYFCLSCIEDMYLNGIHHCPLCRFDFSDWLLSTVPIP